jgi:DNA-binding FrmR family transcriptional regulator
MADETSRKVKSRLNRIAGQVAGIQRMVGEKRYCVEVLNQIAAVRSALDALGVEILTNHLESCVLGHGTGTEHAHAEAMSKDQLVTEVRTVLSRFLK